VLCGEVQNTVNGKMKLSAVEVQVPLCFNIGSNNRSHNMHIRNRTGRMHEVIYITRHTALKMKACHTITLIELVHRKS